MLDRKGLGDIAASQVGAAGQPDLLMLERRRLMCVHSRGTQDFVAFGAIQSECRTIP